MIPAPTASNVAPPATPAATHALRSKALRGTTWAFTGFAASQLLRLGGNLVLSRLLYPGAFGVMTLFTLLLMGIQMCSDVGFGQCVVQHARGTERRFQNTVWTLQVIRGAASFLLLSSLGWVIWRIYGNVEYKGVPRIIVYLPFIALTALISSFDSSRVFLANRTLALRRLVAIDLAAQAAGIAVMVAWAIISPSLAALVGGEIVRAALRALATHFLLPGERNAFAWDPEAARYVLSFGKWVAASSAMTFLAMQSDRLMLAKLVTIDIVGVYGIALMLANLPATVLSRLGTALLFPALAERRRIDPSSFGAALLRLRGNLLPVTLAISVCITIWSPAFFRFCYDERYRAAMWICPALAPYVWFSALQASCDRALLALEQSRALAWSRIVNFATTVIGCWMGFRLGALPGLVIGVTASNLCGHLVVQYSLRVLGIRIAGQDLRYTAAAIGLCALGWLGQRYLLLGVPDSDHAGLLLRAPLLVLLPAPVAGWAFHRVRGLFSARRGNAPDATPAT